MMMLRSVLYVPGNSLRMMVKAATTAADALVLDLEDSVAPADKATARVLVRDALKALKLNGMTTLVRINALSTSLAQEDLEFVVSKHLDGVVLPKAESASDVEELDAMLTGEERCKALESGRIVVIPIVESALGVVNAYSIASSHGRITSVAFGAGDYCRDLGRNPSFVSDDQIELLYARSQIVNAAVAARVRALDTVYFGQLTDREGFMRESRMALQLGFAGKALIHPSQIDFVNRVFRPSESEVEYARSLAVAFEDAQSRGLGAVSFDGRMIDVMSYRQAVDFVQLSEEFRLRDDGMGPAPEGTLSSFFTANEE